MYAMKYMDGTPVDEAYAANIARLVSGAAEAIEIYPEDELEAAAQASRQTMTLPI